MRAGDLDRARAEIRFRIFVSDDRDQAAMLLRADRDFAQLADDRRIALVRRMDGNGAIAQHGFRTRRGDRDIIALFGKDDIPVRILLDIGIGLAAGQRVFEVPHVAFDFPGLDFKIGDRRFELRIPVDQPLAAVDQAFLIERDEDFENGLGQTLVHGEAFARPVAGCAEALQLVEDQAARLFLPFPDALDKGLAAHLATAGKLSLGQLALDDHLRGNARMVHARLPQHVLAAHALEADHDILQRVVERVPHVQRPGHIRRRDDDGEAFRTSLCVGTGTEGVRIVPGFGDLRFDGGGIVGLFEHFLTRFSF